jgi:8-oxo-dGTP diphosphatase
MKSPDFERPIVTVDTVILTLIDHRLHALLVERQVEPSKGVATLPGGYVHTETDSDSEAAARRVLATKAGIELRHLEQLETFSGNSRDARGWSVSITYLALVQRDELAQMSDRAHWVAVDDIQDLPFDHGKILEAGLRRVRDKSSYSSLPAFLLPRSFTLPQLQQVYEEVLGVDLNPAAFRRKIVEQGIIEAIDEQMPSAKGAGRPAQVYRLSQERLQDMGRVVMTPDTRRGGPKP